MGAISHNGFPSARLEFLRTNFSNQTPPNLTGENVAMNLCYSDPVQLGRAFVNQFSKSSGHLANMLSTHLGVGVGIVCKASGWEGANCFATQIFTH